MPTAVSSPAARFAAGMRNPLRASVMYPPDRSLFRPFSRPGTQESIAATLASSRSPFGLYVHVPFCETHCTYCDYETVPLARHDRASRRAYVDGLLAELDAVAGAIPADHAVEGLDVGGGTPGALEAEDFGRLLAHVSRRFRLVPGFEVSTETTPTLAAADPAKWRSIREAGVSRVSMGIQTAGTGLLATVNRAPHGPGRVRAGMESLRAAGFPIVNVDLMFGLPGLTSRDWAATLDLAIELGPDVVTVYDTVYKNRGIASQAPRLGAVPSPADYASQYGAAFERLTAAGYASRYGSVNFSRVPGRLGTSRYLEGRILRGHDYVGTGLYASSLVGRSWRFGPKEYAAWSAAPGELRADSLYELPDAHVMAKYALLALSYGFLPRGPFEARFGRQPTAVFGPELAFLEGERLLARAPDGWELVPGRFGELPGIRSLFYPDDAVPLLSLPVLRSRATA